MERLEQYLDKEFVLKSGRLLYFNGVHYNNNTLTDKIARAAVKKYPSLENKFINERERRVLEVKLEGRKANIQAQDAVKDEAVEKRVALLIEAGDLESAEKEAGKILSEETREEFLGKIAKAVEKAEKAAKKEEKKEEAKPQTEEEKVAEEEKKKKEAEAKEAEREAGLKPAYKGKRTKVQKTVEGLIELGKFEEAKIEASKLHAPDTAPLVKLIEEAEAKAKEKPE